MVFCFGFQMPEYKFTKILLQVLLVMKHKQNQMPQEKKIWHFTLKVSKQSKREWVNERTLYSFFSENTILCTLWWISESLYMVNVWRWMWKQINKSSAKGKLRDPESFATSVRKDTISHCTYNSYPLCSNPYWQSQQSAFLAFNTWTLRWHLGLSGDFCSP